MSRTLVVDTSVVTAAGDLDKEAAASSGCASVLKVIYDICHHVAMTDELQTEWYKHISNYSLEWFSDMISKKKIVRVDMSSCPDLPREIADHHDAILLRTALVAERTILSLDDQARDDFRSYCGNVLALGKIAWVNPSRDAEECVRWLRNNAPHNKSNQLCASS